MTTDAQTIVPEACVQLSPEMEAEILRKIRSLRFGSVEVVVHASRIVQIERRDRKRFDSR